MGGFQLRLRTVLFAIVAVAVPTYFTIFPRSAAWPGEARVPIFLGWLLVVGLVGASAARLDERVASYFARRSEERADEQFMAGSIAIRSVLKDCPEHLRDCEWRVFLYDQTLDRLLPSYEPSGAMARSAGWQPGRGATGRCYELGEYVIARGDQCSDATYGLTDDEQERYGNLQVVACHPLRTASRKTIGVLTASSTTDDGALAGPDGVDWHIRTAKVVERLLIDVLGHADDD